jgi:hypothetical protein
MKIILKAIELSIVIIFIEFNIISAGMVLKIKYLCIKLNVN